MRRLTDKLDALRLFVGVPLVVGALLVAWTFYPAPPKSRAFDCPKDANCATVEGGKTCWHRRGDEAGEWGCK